jgi:hypothetical protein
VFSLRNEPKNSGIASLFLAAKANSAVLINAAARPWFLIGHKQPKMLDVRLNHLCDRDDNSIDRFSVEFSDFRNN